jgi:FkbM family methyltransferase
MPRDDIHTGQNIAPRLSTRGHGLTPDTLSLVKRIAFLILFVAVVALALFIPATRYSILVLAGHGHGCSLARAFDIPRHEKDITQVKDDVLSQTRLIEKERNGLEHYATPDGDYWTPANSLYILPFNIAEQLTHIYGTGPRSVRKGDIVLDCGANVGVFIRTSLRAGAEKIVAIEPAPDNIECLRRNFPQEIASGRVVLVPKGVWDKEDFLDLLVDPDNQPADSFVIHRPGAKAVARVPLTTIDHLAAELQLPRVDFIKMDIEGAEVRALAGAKGTLARFHPRMSLCTYHVDDHPRQVPIAAREGWSGYSVECGTCLYGDWKVRPEVLFFF